MSVIWSSDAHVTSPDAAAQMIYGKMMVFPQKAQKAPSRLTSALRVLM